MDFYIDVRIVNLLISYDPARHRLPVIIERTKDSHFRKNRFVKSLKNCLCMVKPIKLEISFVLSSDIDIRPQASKQKDNERSIRSLDQFLNK